MGRSSYIKLVCSVKSRFENNCSKWCEILEIVENEKDAYEIADAIRIVLPSSFSKKEQKKYHFEFLKINVVPRDGRYIINVSYN